MSYYDRLEPTVTTIVEKFHSKYDPHHQADLIGAAHQVIVENRERFTTEQPEDFNEGEYLTVILGRAMVDEFRRTFECGTRASLYTVPQERLCRMPAPSSWYGRLLSDLSPDAQYLVQLALTTEFREQRVHRSRLQVIKRLLKIRGWTRQRINATVRELKRSIDDH